MSNTSLIIEDHLQILRYKKGIKLVNASSENKNLLTVGRLKAASFSVYFLDKEGNTVKINDEGAKICGFVSAFDAVGKSLLDVAEESSALSLIHNSITVIEDESIKIFEERNLRKGCVAMQFLSIKSPWYNHEDDIIGTLGCSIVLGQHSLANSLSEIRQLGLLDNNLLPSSSAYIPQLQVNHIALSKRELECLNLTVKGYTAKKIARELQISHRTVEEYIYNMRVKVGASSKAELIEMTMGSG